GEVYGRRHKRRRGRNHRSGQRCTPKVIHSARKRTRRRRLPLAMDRRRSDRGCTSSWVRSCSNISLTRVSAMRGTMLLCTVSTPGTKREPSLAPRDRASYGNTQFRADMDVPTNAKGPGSVAKREMRHRGSLHNRLRGAYDDQKR
uniref:Uncharacterized protein n=1 Tax=Parascaris univalens TaxID=6257 RepID=A0A915AZ82_PARUN